MPVRIAPNALVILIGPSGSGKSTWAGEWFPPDYIVSSDRLRAMVGAGERDQRASADAFELLDLLVAKRLKRGLLTVVDTLGTDEKRRTSWIEMAARHQRPVSIVVFDTTAADCRKNNKARPNPVPTKALSAQLKSWPAQREAVAVAFGDHHSPGPVELVPQALLAGAAASMRQKEAPVDLSFGLTISAFDWPGGNEAIGPRLAEIAVEAERAGFESLWLMDHFIQIPQVGREWDPMLESYTTLGFLAGATQQITLGTLVTGITYRNLAHLAKTVATLDVLSGGRARCGLGAAWFEKEHQLYGYDFPPVAERFERLEDALQLLPLMWGPGSPEFIGSHLSTTAATCYPRPLQEHLPILVGGSGEKKTLRLVAQYADACNIFGEPDVVAQKVAVLHQHCSDLGRDPADISVTQLSTVLCGPTGEDVARRVETLAPQGMPPELFANQMLAGTPQDHVGRFRLLAEAGANEVIVSLRDLSLPDAVANFGPVIDAFRR